ncbi:hypothetical protein Dda_3028 [Drechslerella dactyloides]|uniref:Uncharacterized protein n=1 Tax=Drechslerella dactyloides TaxID=74499 RepID=A0AAD6NMF9_DREDA|nr:hypothetical protein Dda_3028 [Drechslerella dactyloides]
MGKVVWTADNDRKVCAFDHKPTLKLRLTSLSLELLIRLIDKSAKSYNSEALCKLFEGATPKAIEERIAKLKREAKALDARCAVQPSAPHKPKGNYYTAPPVPGQPYGGFKRNIAQAQSEGEKPDDEKEGGKAAPGKVVKKARTTKKKSVAKATVTPAGDGKQTDEKPDAETPTTEVSAIPAAVASTGGSEDAKMENGL